MIAALIPIAETSLSVPTLLAFLILRIMDVCASNVFSSLLTSREECDYALPSWLVCATQSTRL